MLSLLIATMRDFLRPRRDLLLENLALRQQILVLQRTNPRQPFRDRDRAFWVLLCQWWSGWRRPLQLVQPETVITRTIIVDIVNSINLQAMTKPTEPKAVSRSAWAGPVDQARDSPAYDGEAHMRHGTRWFVGLALAVMAITPAMALGTSKEVHGGPSRLATDAEREQALKQGGDTFGSALPITSVPFSDSGTTLGYVDDYDAVCLESVDGSAPDVVYVFTAPATGTYDFSLCGSDFDTVLFIHEVHSSLVACNDDWMYAAPVEDPCLLDSRITDFPAQAGEIYYLVVDGYQDEAGAYELSVQSSTPCPLEPAGYAVAEGEPSLGAAPDTYNCGCSCAGEMVFQEVVGNQDGAAAVMLEHGWRSDSSRDADWFQFTAGSTGNVHLVSTPV